MLKPGNVAQRGNAEASANLTRWKVGLVVLFIIVVILVTSYFGWLTTPGPKRIEVVSLALELVATLLGGLAFFDLLQSVKSSEKILNSLSTRGEHFPVSLKRISDILAKEGIERVRIMVDFVDYGKYAEPSWNPRWNEDYRRMLRELADKRVPIEILSYERDFGEKELRERFKNFEGTPRYKYWLDRWDLPPTTAMDGFIRYMQDREGEWPGDLKPRVKFREIGAALPLFCWIVTTKDHYYEQAVVCFPLHNISPEFGPGRRLRGEELSFTTNDPHILAGLANLFDGLFASAHASGLGDH
jgi:hypothetical protein